MKRRSLTHLASAFYLSVYGIIVVAQYYDTDVNKEYAIRGNSAILKCVVPSFVADFVKVLSWHTDQGEEFVPGDDFGITFRDIRSANSPIPTHLSCEQKISLLHLRRYGNSSSTGTRIADVRCSERPAVL